MWEISSLAYDPRLTAEAGFRPALADWVKMTMDRWFPEHPGSARDRTPFFTTAFF
jgi:hypothetical protein